MMDRLKRAGERLRAAFRSAGRSLSTTNTSWPDAYGEGFIFIDTTTPVDTDTNKDSRFWEDTDSSSSASSWFGSSESNSDSSSGSSDD